MLPSPSREVLEAYARELQRTWLTGKVSASWSLGTLRENFPSEQVIQLLLFQVDTRLLQFMQESGWWDWRDGRLLTQLGDFLDQAHERLAIPHVQLAPMLFNSLYHSLHFLLQPKAALAQFYFGQQPTLTLAEFHFYSRYVHYFDFTAAALLSFAQRHHLATIDRSLWEEKFDRILEVYQEETQEETEAYQRRLLEALAQKKWDQIQAHWKQLAESAEDLIGSVLSEESSSDDSLLQNLFGTSPGVGGASEGEKARNPLLSAIDYEPRKLISERFQPQPRRVEALQRFDIESIPIHKQFVFIQRIFEGDPLAFRQAIERLNSLTSLNEARTALQSWKSASTDPEVFSEFEKWVAARFTS